MEKTGLRSCGCLLLKRQKGYLLLELLFSLLLGSAALLLLLRITSNTLGNMQRVREQLLLENARRHLVLQLEKTLSFETTQVKIKDNKISCISLTGNKKYLIYAEKQKLLQKTTTGAGSGVNPLSLEEVSVQDWQAKAVDSKQADISFKLCGSSQKLMVRQRVYCYNAEVIFDE